MMSEVWPEPVAKKTRQRSVPAEVVIENAEWLLANGAMAWEVAATLNRSQAALARWMYRHGRSDLAQRLDPERMAAA